MGKKAASYIHLPHIFSSKAPLVPHASTIIFEKPNMLRPIAIETVDFISSLVRFKLVIDAIPYCPDPAHDESEMTTVLSLVVV